MLVSWIGTSECILGALEWNYHPKEEEVGGGGGEGGGGGGRKKEGRKGEEHMQICWMAKGPSD